MRTRIGLLMWNWQKLSSNHYKKSTGTELPPKKNLKQTIDELSNINKVSLVYEMA